MEDNKNPFKEDEQIKEEQQEQQEQQNTAEEQNNEDENTPQENEKKEDDYKEKYEELNNKYLRLAADFDNFRKRTIQEKQDLSEFTTCEVLKKIVQILDTFERANEHLKNIEECKTLKEGYDVVYKQFVDTLQKIGMKEIEALGQVFNPNEHEAITQVPTDEYEPDTIAVVAQKGYKLDERIIRPALVGVAKKKEDE